MVFRDLLDFMGIDLRRVTFSWVSAAEGAKWAELVNETTNTVRALGPYKELQQLAAAGID
jgi:coenzyme F420-reducing hydrogenase delta subunit